MNKPVEIPVYTADDYINSSSPYEWLYEHKENKFLLNQLLQRMKLQAGSLGVRCFVSLWNAYLESKAKDSGEKFDNSTQFDGQTTELYSGQYICDEYGISRLDKFGYPQVICSHPIMPVRRLVNIDSGEERLELAYKKGKSWRSAIVEKTALASQSGILQLAANGIIVNSENAKALSTYLFEMEQLNYDELTEQKSVGRLGWVGAHGFAPYVDNLIFDGENNFKHIFNAVKSSGDRQKWLDAMLKLRAEKSIARFALAAAFASAILEPCGLLSFFLHFWGGQGSGKTVSLMVAASVWATPKMGEYISTFNSTDVGMEMTASFLNSLPFCLDELQIQASAGIKEFDKMIYKLSEGVGKTRGAKAGGLRKTATWRNCMITTGEYPIINASSMGGASARVIEIECADKVYSDLVGLCAVINENYGFAGREFIEYLRTEGAIERISALQKDYFRELLKSDSTDKQAASAAALLAADEIATELIFKDGNNLTLEDITRIMVKKEDVNVNYRALDYIYELVGRNPNHFKTNDYGSYQGEVWGKYANGYIYIIKSVFDREMSYAGFNSTAFLAWAMRQNYIVAEKGKRTKKARVGDSLANCVCILHPDIMQEQRAQQSQIIEDNEGDLPY